MTIRNKVLLLMLVGLLVGLALGYGGRTLLQAETNEDIAIAVAKDCNAFWTKQLDDFQNELDARCQCR